MNQENASKTNESKKTSSSAESCGEEKKVIQLTSFGYKIAPPPPANLVMDVRFLKNPYWVEELRPLTGKDASVQHYVLEQQMAIELIEQLIELISRIAPAMLNSKTSTFRVALGCTGGQHRSAAVVEETARRLAEKLTDYKVVKLHRELDPDSADEIKKPLQKAEAGR